MEQIKKSFTEIRDEYIQNGFLIPQIIYVISFSGFYGSYYLSCFFYQIITRRKTIISRAFIGNTIPQEAYEFAKSIPKKTCINNDYLLLFILCIYILIHLKLSTSLVIQVINEYIKTPY